MKERKLKNWIEITGHIVHRITYFIQQNKLKIKTKSEVKFCLQNVELLLKPLNLNHLVPSKTMLDKFVAVRILHVSYYNYCFLILLTIFEDTRQIYSLGRLERSRKQNSAHNLCGVSLCITGYLLMLFLDFIFYKIVPIKTKFQLRFKIPLETVN